MNKYDDYEFRAISAEGSKNWPHQWDGDCDASFQAYKKKVDAGQRVSALPFIRAQEALFAKMTEEERENCPPLLNRKLASKTRLV